MSTPIKFDPDKEGLYRADRTGSRPLNAPQSKKDFSRIMAKGEKPKESAAEIARKAAKERKYSDIADAAEDASTTNEAELSELVDSNGKVIAGKSQGILGKETGERVAKESPFDIYTQASSKKQLKSLGLDTQSTDSGEEVAEMAERASGYNKSDGEKKPTGAMAQQSSDAGQSLAMNEKPKAPVEDQGERAETRSAMSRRLAGKEIAGKESPFDLYAHPSKGQLKALGLDDQSLDALETASLDKNPALLAKKAAAAKVGVTDDSSKVASQESPLKMFSHRARASTPQSVDERGRDAVNEEIRQKEIEKTFAHGTVEVALARSNGIEDIHSLPTAAPIPTKKENGLGFGREQQPDLSYVNPLQAPLAPTTNATNGTTETAKSIAPQLQEIIDQIVQKMYTAKVGGETDTTIVLKHPPHFEGATVIIKSFETAPGEFNIQFENLSPQAKQLLDMQENQKSLKLALEEKGYAVHIITASTDIDSSARIYDDSHQANNQHREEEEKRGRSDAEEQDERRNT